MYRYRKENHYKRKKIDLLMEKYSPGGAGENYSFCVFLG